MRNRDPRRFRRFLAAAFLCLAWGISLASCSLKNEVAPDGWGESPPEIQTLPAAYIFTDRAVLNGTVNPHGMDAGSWFEFGTDPALSAWTATTAEGGGAGTSPHPFRATVRGLEPYKTYYYRAAASNRFGTRKGTIRSFPTGEYYVAVGDSITAGSHGSGYEPVLGDLLSDAKGYPITVANLGVTGATAADGLKTVSFALSTLPHAKYFLVMYGTNDASSSGPVPSGKGLRPGNPGYAGSYKESMQKIISTILDAGRTPYLAKVPFAGNSSVELRSLREYNQVVEELVSENHIAVPPPDFFSYFQAHPGELADGIHPNRAGYGSMADLWLEALSR